MKISAPTAVTSSAPDAHDTAAVEQLTLLPATSTPTRFLLSKDTRERGMRHVAEIRQMLAARSAGSATELTPRLAPRHDRAA